MCSRGSTSPRPPHLDSMREKKTVKISSKKKNLKENFLIKVPIKKSDFNKYSGARMDGHSPIQPCNSLWSKIALRMLPLYICCTSSVPVLKF